METIGKRISRLRAEKGWSRPELGRRMAQALKRAKPFSGEVVRLYEEGENSPGKDARRALAAVFERTEAYMEFGDSPQAKRLEEPAAGYDVAQDAREAILLHLYRGLFSLQQQRLIQGLRALFDANQITRKELGQKPLRGVSDDQVEQAFGKVPAQRKRAKRSSPRDLGDAMGDFLNDE